MVDQPIAPVRAENWENEGGSLKTGSYAEDFGVTRVVTETFLVGGYRYTDLAHAIAQAKRMRPGGSAS